MLDATTKRARVIMLAVLVGAGSISIAHEARNNPSPTAKPVYTSGLMFLGQVNTHQPGCALHDDGDIPMDRVIHSFLAFVCPSQVVVAGQ